MGSIKKDIIIDYLDREIIKKLSENARMPFSDLAKELNISNSLVHLRVRKMQETGIISGFTVKLNTKEIGYETVTYTGIVTKEARFSYSIAEKLKEFGVIKAEKVFIKIAINDKRANGISPGLHELDLGISAQSALEQLLDPKRNRGLFGFVEGLRKNEIFDLLAKSKLVTGKYSGNAKIDPLYKTKDVEGFLFPARYSIVPGTTFDQAVDQMIQRFYISAKQSGIENGYRGFSPFELLIIASMTQSEGDIVDFPKIARVIYNRLEIGMPLQINATIHIQTKKHVYETTTALAS